MNLRWTFLKVAAGWVSSLCGHIWVGNVRHSCNLKSARSLVERQRRPSPQLANRRLSPQLTKRCRRRRFLPACDVCANWLRDLFFRVCVARITSRSLRPRFPTQQWRRWRRPPRICSKMTSSVAWVCVCLAIARACLTDDALAKIWSGLVTCSVVFVRLVGAWCSPW